MLIACQPVRDARQTIAVADSLRVNEGVTCDDSLALANAYTTFGHWRLIYPDDYARSCYYYGRMLRNRGDQVAAMQAFIAGTHAPYIHRIIPLPYFSDYHILGRIYSNMGTMCHLDGEFQLSYDMHELSAMSFKKAGNSLRYYYAQISKAFELIELNKTEEALAMLKDIEIACSDEYVESLTNLTRGYAFRQTLQYDSALHYADKVNPAYRDPAFLTLKAQCFASLKQSDSAVLYASQVMNHPSAPIQNKYNVAYILTHGDTTLNELTRDSLIDYRADIGVMRREEKSKLSHAVEILHFEIQNTFSSTKRAIAIVLIILIPCLLLFMLGQLKRRLHTIHEETALKQEVLHTYEIQQGKRLREVENICALLRSSNNIKDVLHWKVYEDMCATVDQKLDNFTHFLLKDVPLNETEIRLCILVVIDIPQKRIAELLPCAESSVKTIKRRTAQKLHTTGKDLRKVLLNYIVGDLN